MKVDIRDISVLRALRPLEVAGYLRSTGWSLTEQIPERATVWQHPGAEEFEVFLPLDRRLTDFAARMAEVLRAVAYAEARSQLEVLHDLTQSGHDIIRIRAAFEGSGDGTIPIDAGTEVIERARDMLLSVASAAAERRSFFPTRKPALATDYMARVRLGQTELGSYVVTLLSPVAPALRVAAQQDLGLEDPFERKVTLMLAGSLQAMRDAATDATATGSFDSFSEAVDRGVTANLCEAIAGMTGALGLAADLEIGVSWSPTRPIAADTVSATRFSPDTAPVISEAARIMREATPIDEYRAVGLVVRLAQVPPEQSGRVWVLTVADDRPRTIGMTLGPADYPSAIHASRASRRGPY